MEKELNSNLNWHKYCFVPDCKNTTVSAPTKVFVNVPINPLKRKAWCEAVGYPLKKFKSRMHCCEDHFDLQHDLENYMQWKIMGSQKILKSDVIPRFNLKKAAGDSQQTGPHCHLAEVKLTLFEETGPVQISEEKQISSNESFDYVLPSTLSSCNAMAFENKYTQSDIEMDCKFVQVKPEVLSKRIQTLVTPTRSVGINCDLIQDNVLTVPSVSDTVKKLKINEEALDDTTNTFSSLALDSSSSYNLSCEKTSSNSDKLQIDVLKNNIFKNYTKVLIVHDPVTFIGISKDCLFIINLLQKVSSLEIRDIYLTLKKVKTNLPFAMLAYEFSLSKSSASRIFKKTVHELAKYFKQFIVWPEKEFILFNLPLQFSYRYSNVQSIIDCFEIEIEKPSNAVNQALTWSDYKKCNTAKFLISITPDGLINYISEGVCGRSSDMAIVENCGYLNKLPQNVSVLADRGFKQLDSLLLKKKCTLIRPPSVTQNVKSSKQEVKLTKQIASIRIHVERAINRIRNFQMLNIHTRVDNNLLDCLDSAVIVATGIVNLQSPIIKQFD